MNNNVLSSKNIKTSKFNTEERLQNFATRRYWSSVRNKKKKESYSSTRSWKSTSTCREILISRKYMIRQSMRKFKKQLFRDNSKKKQRKRDVRRKESLLKSWQRRRLKS